jgi:hypothetical protein
MRVVAKYADPVTGVESSEMFSILIFTDSADSENLELDDTMADEQDRVMNIDPVRATSDTISLAVQLYRNRASGAANDGLVPDSDAKYYWEMQQGDVWVAITSDNQVFIQELVLGKAITLGLDYFDDIMLRVRAEYAPSGAGSGLYSPYIYYSLRRVQSQNTVGECIPDAGAKAMPDSIIKRHMKLTDDQGDLTSALLNKYYRIDWYRKISGSGSRVFVNRGEYMTAVASDLGLTLTNVVNILPQVSRVLCYKPLTFGGAVITFNNKTLVGQNIKPV